MNTKFKNSWELLKASLTVTLRFRKLLWFPVLTTILTGFIVLFFLSAMALPVLLHLHDKSYRLDQKQHWVALKGYYVPAQGAKPKPIPPAAPAKKAFGRLFTVDLSGANTPGHSATAHASPLESLSLLLLYFLSMFLATFFNVAFYSEIIEALNGRGVSFRRGLNVARRRLPSILAWSLLAGTVGWTLRSIEQILPFAASIVTRVIWVGWSVAGVVV